MVVKPFTQADGNLVFESPDATFNYRVAAVIRLGGYVLLHRALSDDFWALPGGRPHHFESAPDALRREMREEFGESVSVGALCAVIEVHFAQVHEVNLCFDVALPRDSRLRDLEIEHAGEEVGIPLVFRWFREDRLHAIRLLPRPVAAALTRRPNGCGYWFDDERAGSSAHSWERNEHMPANHRFDAAEESRAAGIAYHLTPAEVWESQKESGLYVPEAFPTDGFVHTTNGLDPLLEVANLFYQGDERDYRVLVLSVPDLNADVRYDDANRIYPHVYGPLNTSAVIGELPVRRGADGTFLGFE